MKSILVISFALLASTLLNAKENNYVGKEFVFALGKNIIFLEEFSKKEMQLNLFSEEDNNNIQLFFSGTKVLDTIIGKNQSFRYDLNKIKDYELVGSSFISNKMFKIICNQNTTANIISSAFNSTDATTLIPTKHCGNEYTLSSWNSKLENQNPADTNNFYGYGLIIGLENDTKIKITSKSKVYDGINDVNNIDVTLQKDQVYYFTSGIESEVYDLTGAYIKSNKKIAVISGHRGARVLNIANSRDFLINQVPPNNTNGTEYVIGQLHRNDVEYLPVFRVISLHDENEISLNGYNFKLDKNEWRQFILDSLSLVKSDKPIIVSEYMKTMPEFILGDPLLLNLTPTRQFVNQYSYTVPKVSEITKHFVAISCIDTLVDKIFMNEVLVNDTKFEKVGNTRYVYGVFPVYADTVILTSEYDFGALAFGVGTLDSYGMNLGSNLRNIENIILDKSPVSIISNNCENKIQISDSSDFVSGIESVNYNYKNLENVNLTLNNSIASINYELIDYRKDAEINISVVDSSQNKTDTTLFIKGFTLEANLQIPEELEIQRLENWELSLINTGSYTQNLSFRMNEGRLTTLPTGYRKTNIDTKDSELISLYSYSLSPEQYTDTLFIYNECNKVIKIPIYIHFGFGVDVITKCDVNLSIADKYKNNAQIRRTEIYDISGKLLETIENSTDRDTFTNKYSNQAIIIKEYHQNHIHISKIIIAN